jgi:peptidoglycan/LPS O-acetylase OafA/YrhL
MDSLNRLYYVKDTRPFWKQRLIALGLTVAIAALTIMALTIVLYGGDIANFVGRHVGLSNVTVMAWHVLQWPIALLFVVISFALLYYWGPDAKQQWQWITPGSLVGVLTWIGASLLFRVYLHFFNCYSKTYGSLGAVSCCCCGCIFPDWRSWWAERSPEIEMPRQARPSWGQSARRESRQPCAEICRKLIASASATVLSCRPAKEI